MDADVRDRAQRLLFLLPERPTGSRRIRGKKPQDGRDFLRRDAFCKDDFTYFVLGQTVRQCAKERVFQACRDAAEATREHDDGPDFDDQM